MLAQQDAPRALRTEPTVNRGHSRIRYAGPDLQRTSYHTYDLRKQGFVQETLLTRMLTTAWTSADAPGIVHRLCVHQAGKIYGHGRRRTYLILLWIRWPTALHNRTALRTAWDMCGITRGSRHLGFIVRPGQDNHAGPTRDGL